MGEAKLEAGIYAQAQNPQSKRFMHFCSQFQKVQHAKGKNL